jgi:hypothetical protein
MTEAPLLQEEILLLQLGTQMTLNKFAWILLLVKGPTIAVVAGKKKK